MGGIPLGMCQAHPYELLLIISLYPPIRRGAPQTKVRSWGLGGPNHVLLNMPPEIRCKKGKERRQGTRSRGKGRP